MSGLGQLTKVRERPVSIELHGAQVDLPRGAEHLIKAKGAGSATARLETIVAMDWHAWV